MTIGCAGSRAPRIRRVTATAAFLRPEFLNSTRARVPNRAPAPCDSTSRTALPPPPSTIVPGRVSASFASAPQIEQRHKVKPQRVQEVPEYRTDVDGGAFGRTQSQPQRLHVDIEQRD